MSEPSGAPRSPAVALDRVTSVRGGRRALDAVSLALPAGRVTALIGPNGSGKTTLLHVLAGLLAPSSGLVRVLDGPPGAARQRVAYVLQTPTVGPQLPLTVRDAVAMGRYPARGWLGRLGPADRAAVATAMGRLDVADLADRQVADLSGGQRQRVLVAQGLAQEADLLLLDEPVTALDVVSRQRILAVVDEERAAGRTVVLSTHDLDEAAAADHVVLLANQVVAEGPPAEVLRPEQLRLAYGGRVLVVGEGGDGTVLLDDPHHDH